MIVMSRYKFVAIKLQNNTYNALVNDLDEVVEAKTMKALKREVARILIKFMLENGQRLPKRGEIDIRALYKERTHSEISEEEFRNAKIEEVKLELNDNNITLYVD